MRILLTADLHGREAWYEWILKRAAEFDLVAIGGDLLEQEDVIALIVQVGVLLHWVERFPFKSTHLAMCSGNHDLVERSLVVESKRLFNKPAMNPAGQRLTRALTNGFWMDHLRLNEDVIVDGVVRVLWTPRSETLLVSSMPYAAGSDEAAERPWNEAAQLCGQDRLPWLVLHHEPASGGQLVGGYQGSEGLARRIRHVQPDYVLSGHFHEVPVRTGVFAEKIGRTWCFNPGAVPKAKFPSHIILDTVACTAQHVTWDESGNLRESVVDLNKGTS